MPSFNVIFKEDDLIRGAIYSRLEYLHEVVNGSMAHSPFKQLFLDEMKALLSYCEEKNFMMPEHIKLLCDNDTRDI